MTKLFVEVFSNGVLQTIMEGGELGAKNLLISSMAAATEAMKVSLQTHFLVAHPNLFLTSFSAFKMPILWFFGA